MEAAVYSYVGLALYSTIPTWWSFTFVFIWLAIIIVGRVIGVISTFYCCRLCFKEKTIKFNELLFITYAGMIRGAIAFALVLKIEYDDNSSPQHDDCENCYSKENYSLVVSTTLMLVMFTTLIFGTFMDLVQKFLVPPKKKTPGTGPEAMMRHHSQVSASEYEQIVHPNEEKSVLSDNVSRVSRRPSYLLGRMPNTFANSRFVNWFVNFDETKLRPFLIRNYSLQNVEMQDHFDDVVSRAQNIGGENVEASFMMLDNSMRDGRLASTIVGNEGGGFHRSQTAADVRGRQFSVFQNQNPSKTRKLLDSANQDNSGAVQDVNPLSKSHGLHKQEEEDDAPDFGGGNSGRVIDVKVEDADNDDLSKSGTIITHKSSLNKHPHHSAD